MIPDIEAPTNSKVAKVPQRTHLTTNQQPSCRREIVVDLSRWAERFFYINPDPTGLIKCQIYRPNSVQWLP